MYTSNFSKISGTSFALLAVVLGAFGAHALKETLLIHESIETWKTAVNYQMWHAIALLWLSSTNDTFKLGRLASGCFTIGILLFSGSLYLLALDGPRWLGPITPLGGLSFIIGWSALLVSSLRKTTPSHHDDPN